MENKKIIIITIVLFLLAGTGTFVFASNQGNFNEEDIDYRTDKEPTYNKVENNNSNNNTNNSNEGNATPIPNPGITNDPLVPDNNSGSNSTTNATRPGNTNNSSNNNSNNRPNDSGTSNSQGNSESENNGSSTNSPSEKPIKPVEPERPVIKDTTPPILKIKYNTIDATKGPVIATIISNEPIKSIADWSLSNDKLTLTKAFSNNTSGTVIVYDEANNASTIEYDIKNIDNIAPKATVETSNNNGSKLTFRDITVTITADKDIKPVVGWDLKDNRILSKTFSNIANADYSVKIYDLVGNETEVKYEIRNYDPTSPEVVVDKTETETTITMLYKEPLDDTWVQNENGEYTKVESIPNNSDETIVITMPDGTIKVFESAPNITIKVSNQNEDGTFNKTNKPVEIKIESNKEIEAIEGWILSEDKKTLTKLEYVAKANETVIVKDLSGNSTTLAYSVSYIDTTLPDIKMALASKPNGGIITVTLITTEPTIFEDYNWSANRVGGFAASYTKKVSEEELKKGIKENFHFKDRYDNETSIVAILKYENGKIVIDKE